MNKNEWLEDRVKYLKGLKSRSELQELLVTLAENPARNAEDEKLLNAIIRGEKSAMAAAKIQQENLKIVRGKKEAAKKAERAARTHKLCNLGGLVAMAGLADTKTGDELMDKAELLGALIGLAKVPESDPRRLEWKRVGASLLEKDNPI